MRMIMFAAAMIIRASIVLAIWTTAVLVVDIGVGNDTKIDVRDVPYILGLAAGLVWVSVGIMRRFMLAIVWWRPMSASRRTPYFAGMAFKWKIYDSDPEHKGPSPDCIPIPKKDDSISMAWAGSCPDQVDGCTYRLRISGREFEAHPRTKDSGITTIFRINREIDGMPWMT